MVVERAVICGCEITRRRTSSPATRMMSRICAMAAKVAPNAVANALIRAQPTREKREPRRPERKKVAASAQTHGPHLFHVGVAAKHLPDAVLHERGHAIGNGLVADLVDSRRGAGSTASPGRWPRAAHALLDDRGSRCRCNGRSPRGRYSLRFELKPMPRLKNRSLPP